MSSFGRIRGPDLPTNVSAYLPRDIQDSSTTAADGAPLASHNIDCICVVINESQEDLHRSPIELFRDLVGGVCGQSAPAGSVPCNGLCNPDVMIVQQQQLLTLVILDVATVGVACMRAQVVIDGQVRAENTRLAVNRTRYTPAGLIDKRGRVFGESPARHVIPDGLEQGRSSSFAVGKYGEQVWMKQELIRIHHDDVVCDAEGTFVSVVLDFDQTSVVMPLLRIKDYSFGYVTGLNDVLSSVCRVVVIYKDTLSKGTVMAEKEGKPLLSRYKLKSSNWLRISPSLTL